MSLGHADTVEEGRVVEGGAMVDTQGREDFGPEASILSMNSESERCCCQLKGVKSLHEETGTYFAAVVVATRAHCTKMSKFVIQTGVASPVSLATQSLTAGVVGRRRVTASCA